MPCGRFIKLSTGLHNASLIALLNSTCTELDEQDDTELAKNAQSHARIHAFFSTILLLNAVAKQ